jgi:hypothetical protein
MPGTKTSGNRTATRGKPVRIKRRLTKQAALALGLLASLRLGRPATEAEEDALLSALIEEERQRVLAQSPTTPPA